MNQKIKPHKALAAFRETTLPGTKGPLDRNFDLVVTTDEVKSALKETEEFQATTQAQIDNPDRSEWTPIDDFLFPTSKRILIDQATKTQKKLLDLLTVVENSGGSYAYMGAAFTEQFGELPLQTQQILAYATGRFGVSKRRVKRMQQAAQKEREYSEIDTITFPTYPGGFTPVLTDKDRRILKEQQEQDELAQAFEIALDALEAR